MTIQLTIYVFVLLAAFGCSKDDSAEVRWPFEGIYLNATITSSYYQEGNLINITTATDTVSLAKEGDKLRFAYNNTSVLLTHKPEHIPGISQPNSLYFSESPYGGYNWQCYINYITKSIVLTDRDGSSGHSWVTKITFSY